MRITKIEEEEHGLLVLVGEYYEYFIPKTAYDMVIHGNVSSWIEQIMWKSWADIDSLYSIGAILSKHCQAGIIDWLETYESAELLIMGKTDPVKITENLNRFGFYI